MFFCSCQFVQFFFLAYVPCSLPNCGLQTYIPDLSSTCISYLMVTRLRLSSWDTGFKALYGLIVIVFTVQNSLRWDSSSYHSNPVTEGFCFCFFLHKPTVLTDRAWTPLTVHIACREASSCLFEYVQPYRRWVSRCWLINCSLTGWLRSTVNINRRLDLFCSFP